ncbi:hypothetical protein AAHC03_020931 [Spirometra sp. Aus1]
MDQHGQCAVSLISAPSGANTCIKGGVSLSEGDEAIDTIVVCASEECKFACRLHKTCLEQWKTCAESQMQDLADAATTINSAALPPGSDDCSGNFRQFSDAFSALKSLLDCPECGTSRLRLARVTDKGNLQAKPFDSLLDEAVILFSLLNQSAASNAGSEAGKPTSTPSLPNQPADEIHDLAGQFSGLMTRGPDSGGGGCELEPRSPPRLTLPADHHTKSLTVAVPQKAGRRLRGSNQVLPRHASSSSSSCGGAALEEDPRGAPRPGPHRFSDTTAPPSNLLLLGAGNSGGVQYLQGGLLGDQAGGGSPFACDTMLRQGKRCDFFKQQKQKQRFAPVCRQLRAAMTSGSTSGIASGLSSSSVSFRSQGITSLSSLDSLGQEGEGNLLSSAESGLTPDGLSTEWYFWATMSKDKFTAGDCSNPAQYLPSDGLANTSFPHSLVLQNSCSDASASKAEKASCKQSVGYNCSVPLGTTNDIHPRSGSVSQTYGSHYDHSGSVRPSSSQPPNHVMRSYSINLASLYSAKKPNSKGNIFRQRKDFSAFQVLHPSKKNGYFIQLEDDSCTGNEDTRSFLLCQLTNHGASELYCLACGLAMPVYDHFPVVDGALFLSPICHQPQQQSSGTPRSNVAGAGLQVVWTSPPSSAFGAGVGAVGGAGGNGNSSPRAGQVVSSLAPPPGCTGPRQQQSQTFFGSGYRHRQGQPVCQERYLHAICMTCMRSTHSLPNSPGSPSPTDSTSTSSWGTTPPSPPLPPQIICRFCATPWDGSTLLIGGMYTYDLFASSPCCPDHLKCKSCGRMALSSHKTRRAESFAGTTPSGWTTVADEKPRRMSEGAQEEPSSLSPLLPLPFFSQYSNRICCQHCRSIDYHFIKPFNEAYTVIFPHNHTSR